MTFSNPVVGGQNGELIRAAIRSPNYVPGVSGWTINRDGSAEFNNVTIRFDLTTGSIVVGDPSGPQVVIRTDGSKGLIEFPTNAATEVLNPEIYSQIINEGTAAELLILNLTSGTTSAPNRPAVAIESGADDLSFPSRIRLNVGSSTLEVRDDQIDVVNTELYIDKVNDPNFPSRVTHGHKGSGSTATTLAATDTLITNAATTGVYLVNGNQYRVDVQIQFLQSVGSSAAGTQRVNFTLWDGAVGGTQLGNTIERTNDGVGTAITTYNFSFLFEFTGTTGSRTLNLAGRDAAGADTIDAVVNSRYFMIVENIGDPAQFV